MNAIRVILDVDQDPPLDGMDADKTVRVQSGVVFERIPYSMSSGKSAVCITAPLPDGRAVFIELSMANFMGAATAFKAAEERTAECDGRN